MEETEYKPQASSESQPSPGAADPKSSRRVVRRVSVGAALATVGVLAVALSVHAASGTTGSPSHLASSLTSGKVERALLSAAVQKLSAPTAPLSGQLVSITASTLIVQSFGGPNGPNGPQGGSTQTVATTAQTRYFQVTSTAMQTLAVGKSVAVAPAFNATGHASTITLLTPESPIAYVQQFGGFGGPGGPPPGGGGPPPGGGQGGPGGPGGQGGPDDRAAPSLNFYGTITALSSKSITVKTLQGKTSTVTITAATKLFRLVPISRASLHPKTFVAWNASLVNGQVTARNVITAQSGTMVTIFSPGKSIL